jgi:hypothetical protein
MPSLAQRLDFVESRPGLPWPGVRRHEHTLNVFAKPPAHPQRMTTAIQTKEIASAPHRLNVVNPSHARWKYAVTSRPTNNRSPGVVGIGRNPRRSGLGATICQTVIDTRITAITIKKIAVGKVHAIQSNLIARLLSYATERKTFSHIVAHKINYERAGYDREHAGGGE